MASDERCNHRLEVGLTDEDFPTNPCGRPTWEDHDRCIWHANVEGKTAEMLKDARPESGANLDGAYLEEATLVGVDWFADASLIGAHFTGADINGTDFSNANLMLASLKNISGMSADFTEANLEGAVFTNADLREATLERALINETVFTNAHIGAGTSFGDVTIYDSDSVTPRLNGTPPLEASAWAYRQLRQLYQANALPELAKESYYREKDARRRLAWDRDNYWEAIKWELSRWVMRYGGSPYRILFVSLLVIVVAALLFPLTGGIQEIQDGQTITYTIENPKNAPTWWIGRVFFKSLYFSVVTFATLGYGDIQPIGTWARTLAGVETIIGTLLSALLVFVLARMVTW